MFFDKEKPYQIDLSDKYKTDDPEEEVACPYLVDGKGCNLDNEHKPFDCKIWPLRVMDKEGELVIALTPTCPAINKVGVAKVRKLVNEELRELIMEYAKTHPAIIKKYREGFTVI